MENSTQDQLIKQLNRINGQIAGVIKMYSEDRACVDIVHQIVAARAGLGKVARELLTCEASRCSKERKIDDLNTVLKELLR